MLVRNNRGAVMLATIFMMLFLVAMLYMVIGIGKTLIMKEGMQDAADAAAYSSAIFNARGMNLIVFINMLMAALIAILIAIRVVQTLLVIGAAIAAGFAWAGGATAGLATELTRQAADMQNHYSKAKKKIEPILEGLHTTQEAISVVVPWVGMVKGMGEAAQHHQPASGAFAIPGSTSLPVESDDFSRLCGKGGELVGGLVAAPLPEEVRSKIGDASEEIAESTSKFLCGDGSGSPPTHTQTIEQSLPRHPDQARCDDGDTAACDKISEDGQLAVPHERDGECQRDCSYHGVYESAARSARRTCEQMPGLSYKDFKWQSCEVDIKFKFNGTDWEEVSRGSRDCELVSSARPPCGYGGTLNEDEWNADSGPAGANEPEPLCRTETEKSLGTQAPGTVRTVQVTEALRLFSCVYVDKRTYNLAESGDTLGGAGSEKKSPHRVEENVELGDEVFQIRAVAFGDKPGPGNAMKGVEVAGRGAKPRGTAGKVGAKVAEVGAELGRLSVAQSEYYFEGDVSPEEWMWQMKWTARLKHFRMPSDEEQKENDERQERNSAAVSQKTKDFGGIKPGQTAEDACRSGGSSKCGKTMDSLSLFDSLVRH